MHASGTRVGPCHNWSHVVSRLTSNTAVELFIVTVVVLMGYCIVAMEVPVGMLDGEVLVVLK
jgi:hypothetical protein